MKISKYIFIGALFLSGCGGSSGIQSEVKGTVSADATLTSDQSVSTVPKCPVDTVVATDCEGHTVTAPVADDCSFRLTLPGGKSFRITFEEKGEVVATTFFHKPQFSEMEIFVKEGTVVELGTITLTGEVASVEEKAEDADDDDQLKEPKDPFCSNRPWVHRVKPRNDPHPELGQDRIAVTAQISAHVHCDIDPATVNAQTFVVAPEDKTLAALTCQYEVEGKPFGSKIECDHQEAMRADTIYRATIDGVKCTDGRQVESRTWRWRTQ